MTKKLNELDQRKETRLPKDTVDRINKNINCMMEIALIIKTDADKVDLERKNNNEDK